MSDTPTAAEGLAACPNPWCLATTKQLPVALKREGWRVVCACGVATHRHSTEAEAIAAWNRRPIPAGDDLVEVVARARKIAAEELCRENWKPGLKAGIYEEILAGNHDNEPIVRIARAALTAIGPRAGEVERDGWHLIADNPPPVACPVLAGRFNADCSEWTLALVSSPPVYPFTHWRFVDAPALAHTPEAEQ